MDAFVVLSLFGRSWRNSLLSNQCARLYFGKWWTKRDSSQFLNISKDFIKTIGFTRDSVIELFARSKRNISVSVDAVSMKM